MSKIALAATCLLLITACGTSQTYHNVVTEETNPAWQKRSIDKVAVVAVTQDRGERVGSETVFADRLTQQGYNVVASHQVFPNLADIDTTEEAARAWAAEGIDGVLTVGVAKSASGYDRTDYWQARGWAYLLGSDNTRAWGDLADINSYWSQGEYSLDVGLWDAKTMQPIWHAQTDSNEWDEGSAGTQRLADGIAEMLRQRGFAD